MKRIGTWLMAAALAAAAAPASAQMMVDTQLVASGLTQPLYATSPVVGGPVYIVQKTGAIRAVLNGSVSTFLSISVATAGERGLLGLAFDPNYTAAGTPGYGRFFIDYVDPSTNQTVIASYKIVEGNPLLANTASRVEIIRIDQTGGFTNHKGGWIGFKPGDADHLYIAMGDGGSSNDPNNNAQNLGVLLGKMLRIDINGDDFPADPNKNYAIPPDNPFVGTSGARGEVFFYGLRNPFRNSFDRENGNFWIADVGQDTREEIDFVASASAGAGGGGHNFGWRVREGFVATPGVGGPLQAGMVDPIMDYPRSWGGSIIGGYVIREPRTGLNGYYIFGDYVSGRIWATRGTGTPFTIASAMDLTAAIDAGGAGPLTAIVSFGEGPNGEIYIVDINGKVVRLTSWRADPSACALSLGPICPAPHDAAKAAAPTKAAK